MEGEFEGGRSMPKVTVSQWCIIVRDLPS